MRLTLLILLIVTLAGTAFAEPGRDARLDRVLALKARMAEERSEAAGNLELTPMLTEIKAVLDSARVAETELRAGLVPGEDPAPGSPLALALAAHGRAVHLRVLHIQARYARLEGRTGLEQRILKSIAEIERPAPPGAPKMRPVSTPTASATNTR